MGNSGSKMIFDAGIRVIEDFLAKSFLGKIASSITAPGRCDRSSAYDDAERARDYIACEINHGIGGAYQTILWLMVLLFIVCLILWLILYAKAKKVVRNFTVATQSRIINMQTQNCTTTFKRADNGACIEMPAKYKTTSASGLGPRVEETRINEVWH